jgi:hypothetical protein
MELSEYKQAYFDLEVALNQTVVISMAAREALRDFPDRLPEDARAAFSEAIKFLQASLRNTEGEDLLATSPSTHSLSHPITGPALLLLLMNSLRGSTVKNLNFSALLAGQELVMILAHFEAFLAETIRAMCSSRPELLRRRKEITWDKVMQCGDWNTLTNHLISEYSLEFGWKSLPDKLRLLRDEHGIAYELPSTDLTLLEDAEQLRHIIIHNGGRVSAEYLRRTARRDVPIGQVLEIDEDLPAAVGIAAELLSAEIFRSVASKFFSASEADFLGVVRRPPQANR